jgi:hypothetical protein
MRGIKRRKKYLSEERDWAQAVRVKLGERSRGISSVLLE